jgi:hypothetical protein
MVSSMGMQAFGSLIGGFGYTTPQLYATVATTTDYYSDKGDKSTYLYSETTYSQVKADWSEVGGFSNEWLQASGQGGLTNPPGVHPDATYIGNNDGREIYKYGDNIYSVGTKGDVSISTLGKDNTNTMMSDHLPGGKYFWKTDMGQDLISAFPMLGSEHNREGLRQMLNDTFWDGLLDDWWPIKIPVFLPDGWDNPEAPPLILTPK